MTKSYDIHDHQIKEMRGFGYGADKSEEPAILCECGSVFPEAPDDVTIPLDVRQQYAIQEYGLHTWLKGNTAMWYFA